MAMAIHSGPIRRQTFELLKEWLDSGCVNEYVRVKRELRVNITEPDGKNVLYTERLCTEEFRWNGEKTRKSNRANYQRDTCQVSQTAFQPIAVQSFYAGTALPHWRDRGRRHQSGDRCADADRSA